MLVLEYQMRHFAARWKNVLLRLYHCDTYLSTIVYGRPA